MTFDTPSHPERTRPEARPSRPAAGLQTPRAFTIAIAVTSVLALAIAFAALLVPQHARGDDVPGLLRWHRNERRVDADLQGWPLEQALRRIAEATGWQVLLEPGLDLQVAARFERRSEREAIAALLGDVNFAVVPGRDTNHPTRLLVFRSSADQATVAVKPGDPKHAPKSDAALGKELVVRLKKGSKTDIQALAKQLGARVAGSIPGLDAYRLVFDDEASAAQARATLAASEDVASVESNYALGTPGQMDRLPGLEAPTLNLKARPAKDGSQVVVALLDTGIPTSGVPHSDFLLPGVTVSGSGAAATTAEGGLSHGPAMFETILEGLANTTSKTDGKPVRVLPIDIYGGRAETSTFELAQGLATALDRGADVINLSLSGPSPSPLVQDLLKQASQSGVIAFAAPGNEPTTANTYPAAYPEVIAVTASDRQGNLAPYANRGGFVDLIAPGTSVVPYAGESWIVNGTSVSTAYASGLAAGLLADSGKSSSDIIKAMRAKLGFQAPPPSTPTRP